MVESISSTIVTINKFDMNKDRKMCGTSRSKGRDNRGADDIGVSPGQPMDVPILASISMVFQIAAPHGLNSKSTFHLEFFISTLQLLSHG